MQLNYYLTFNGQCETAFRFYEQCLGGKIVAMIPHAGSPAEAQVPSEWRDKIMHACLRVGSSTLMACDAPPNHFQPAKGFSVQVAIDDPADAKRSFQELAQDGAVQMPLQKTFWAEHFGMLVDRFGVPWMINCGLAAV